MYDLSGLCRQCPSTRVDLCTSKEIMDECLQLKLQPDVEGRIIGVKMLHYKLIFGLHLCERILKITDNLSKTLQTEKLTDLQAQQIAKYTIQTLQGMRTDDAFNLFYEHVDGLRQHTDTEEPVLPRKRRAPSRYEIGEGEVYCSPTAKDHYDHCYF